MQDDRDKAWVLQRQHSSVYAEAVPQMNPPNQLNDIMLSVSMIEKIATYNECSVCSRSRCNTHLISVLAAPLENIFTKSMKTGRLPPAWKSSLVKPMFKGG